MTKLVFDLFFEKHKKTSNDIFQTKANATFFTIDSAIPNLRQSAIEFISSILLLVIRTVIFASLHGDSWDDLC